VIRLSIPVRQALSKLTLPVLILLAFVLMLLGKADALLGERARTTVGDLLAPIYSALAGPLDRFRAGIDNGHQALTGVADNARLREENERLRKWHDIALSLAAENDTLKANLHWIPDPAVSFVTARVATDAGGVYARSVLLSVGPHHSVTKGQIALDDSGLVGRVTEVGARSARVLLITDMNSRIPVMLEGSRARAILVGTNGPRPHLKYWPEGTMPVEGERVVTSAEANVFPANLPVGTVHYSANRAPEVIPVARLDRLEVVRLFDYGLHGIVAPETARTAGRAAGAGRPGYGSDVPLAESRPASPGPRQ
jgi:rod shape-determining protein MreC